MGEPLFRDQESGNRNQNHRERRAYRRSDPCFLIPVSWWWRNPLRGSALHELLDALDHFLTAAVSDRRIKRTPLAC